jgi:cytosine/adenosine deaminase-related metal-dependent hydrolase
VTSQVEDPFELAYTAGVTQAMAAPDVLTAQAAASELIRAAPAEAVALKGWVVTPDEVLKSGYVVVGDGDTIQAVQKTKPAGARVHDTGGVICPGLIDLHGHPEFNVFAAWEPPQQFPNRYAWRGSDLYHTLVRDPQNILKKALNDQTQLRYAEIRALVGGVTAIQGTSENIKRTESEELVRNVDKTIFGQHRARAVIDLPSGSFRRDDWDKIWGEVANHEVDAVYIHLAEGRRDNERSVKEFQQLVDLGGLQEQAVVIHGTALGREQFDAMAAAKAKLVWSPQSNLRLYSETTNAGEALDAGLLVGLGADWLPSGSTSLLSELKVARRCLIEQGHPVEPHQLVQMVTCDAAAIAGLSDKLGRLEAGRPADLVVFERRHSDPYENIALADPSSVEMVMIGGDIPYGRSDWVQALTPAEQHQRLEALIAWGQPMLLDTRFAAIPQGIPPTLEQLRAELIGNYPQVGPIFA